MITFDQLAASARRAPEADARLEYGNRPLSFGELRLPASRRDKHPIVVFIHGGCWMSEYDIGHVAATTHALAREGYVVWTPEYRRIGNAGGGWPGTFDDIGEAIDFVREVATRYPIVDLERVILAGHSAGGQLALWGASRHRDNAGALRPKGVLSLAGITNLAYYGSVEGDCNSSVTPLMGGTPTDVPERYAAVSPIERLPLGVRSILVHGAHDRTVQPGVARSFAEKARLAGDASTFTMVEAGHFDVVAPNSSVWGTVLTSLAALA